MSLSHLILGLLQQQPMTGYDLNKAFEQTVRHFWMTEQSQIYRALYRIERDGWVEAETVIQTGSPNKKIYRLTAEGQAELTRWVSTPLPEETIRIGWLGQVFFGGAARNAEVIAVLRAYRAEVEARRQILEALLHRISQRPPASRRFQFQRLTLEYGLRTHQTEIEHLDFMIERIHTLPEEE